MTCEQRVILVGELKAVTAIAGSASHCTLGLRPRPASLYFPPPQAHHPSMGKIDWIPLDGHGPHPPHDDSAFLAANEGDWAKVIWTPQGLWTGEIDEEGEQVMFDDATHWAEVGLPQKG